jgi:hypothetical protein
MMQESASVSLVPSVRYPDAYCPRSRLYPRDASLGATSSTQTTPAEIQMILTQPLRRAPNEAIVNRRAYHTLTMSLKTQGSLVESVDYP